MYRWDVKTETSIVFAKLLSMHQGCALISRQCLVLKCIDVIATTVEKSCFCLQDRPLKNQKTLFHWCNDAIHQLVSGQFLQNCHDKLLKRLVWVNGLHPGPSFSTHEKTVRPRTRILGVNASRSLCRSQSSAHNALYSLQTVPSQIV